MSTTVLIVDDHPTFRRLARRLLEDAGYSVVGEAADAAEAIAAATALRPGVVLLNVMLPDGSGIDVARVLSRADSPPAVVLTSSRSACDLGVAVEDAHTRGFIPKDRLSGSAFAALLEGE